MRALLLGTFCIIAGCATDVGTGPALDDTSVEEDSPASDAVSPVDTASTDTARAEDTSKVIDSGTVDTSAADTTVDAKPADAGCTCTAGFACSGGVCEPVGFWVTYVLQGSILNVSWGDPAIPAPGAEYPPDVYVNVSTGVSTDGFATTRTSTVANSYVPKWLETTNGHALPQATVAALKSGLNVSYYDYNGPTRMDVEICGVSKFPITDADLRAGTKRITCPSGKGAGSYIDLVFVPKL